MNDKEKVVVDTSIWIEYFNNPTSKEGEVVKDLLEEDRVVITGSIMAELLQGARTEKDGLAGNKVLSIIEDRQGNLWFGTWGGGVSRYTPTHIIAKGYLDDDKGLLYPLIYQIFEDAKEPSSSLKDLRNLYQQEGNQQFVN
ncbi:MAG: two-component regulator propeller domain-containing protein [bacterium]